MLAYLVIREGSKWTDVFRLAEGRKVTLGRAVTNEIVIKDERCSRYHAEVFLTGGRWTLRDLGSRNGTLVGGERIRGDYALQPGDVVRIAGCQLAFVHDLSKAFTEPPVTGYSSQHAGSPEGDTLSLQIPSQTADSDSVLDAAEPATITHRKSETRFLEPDEEDVATPRVGRAARKLCRLAFALANQPDLISVANLALDGLFQGTHVDAGAVLLLPRAPLPGPPSDNHLQIVASRTDVRPTYQRVPRFLAETVLGEGEAVLARNVQDDSMLGSRDSKGEIYSTGVICAPVRQDGKVIGLVHLYSTDAERSPDPDDLEFTLAVADNLALAIKNLNRQQELAENLSQTQTEIIQLRKRLGAESQIIGSSPQVDRLHQEIARAAPNRSTVLIRGESGTGKELVARAIHFTSPRKKGPFVCINCAALTESLLESELFGHERGAFTGATDRKIGKFEAAHRGTLMLDEMGEMSPAIQAKFLRVLEGHSFERVGGNQSIKVDVRVIAATNRDLEKAVEEGVFRRDLYFRLRVVEITVAPLRKRGDDVVELAHFFLQRLREETGRKIRGFTPDALRHMRQYRWPGNIRELKNVVERAVVLAQSEYIDVGDLALSSLATASESGEMLSHQEEWQPTSLSEMERQHILRTLTATGWNKSRSASILGIERSTLDRKIRRYKLAQK